MLPYCLLSGSVPIRQYNKNGSGVDVAKNPQKILIWVLLITGTKVKIIEFLTIVPGTKVKNDQNYNF